MKIHNKNFWKKIPNYLTFFRIMLLPLIWGSFYLEERPAHIIGFCLFILACVTDFVDGYLARRFNVITILGKTFDPIADKILVVCTLFMLVSKHRVEIIPCLLIISREFIISGLREFLVSINVSLKVTFFSKIKTTLQMIAISMKILGTKGSGIEELDIVSSILIWLSAIITVITGVSYFLSCRKHLDYG